MMDHGADARAGGHDAGRELAVDRLMRPVRLAFRGLSLVLLLVMIALPFVQIVLREFVGRPIIGAEELARFMLICLVYVSLPHVVYAGANIRLEELIMLLPAPALRIFRAGIALVAAGVFLVGGASTWIAVSSNFNTMTPTLQLPYWLFLSSAFAGFLLAASEALVLFYKVLADAPLYVIFPIEEPEDEPLPL